MEAYEVGHNIAVYLQMSFLSNALEPHHLYQALVPFGHFLTLGVGQVGESIDYVRADFVNVKVVGTDYVLNLPHVDEVFGHVFLSFLRSDDHCRSVFGGANLQNYNQPQDIFVVSDVTWELLSLFPITAIVSFLDRCFRRLTAGSNFASGFKSVYSCHKL